MLFCLVWKRVRFGGFSTDDYCKEQNAYRVVFMLSVISKDLRIYKVSAKYFKEKGKKMVCCQLKTRSHDIVYDNSLVLFEDDLSCTLVS